MSFICVEERLRQIEKLLKVSSNVSMTLCEKKEKTNEIEKEIKEIHDRIFILEKEKTYLLGIPLDSLCDISNLCKRCKSNHCMDIFRLQKKTLFCKICREKEIHYLRDETCSICLSVMSHTIMTVTPCITDFANNVFWNIHPFTGQKTIISTYHVQCVELLCKFWNNFIYLSKNSQNIFFYF